MLRNTAYSIIRHRQRTIHSGTSSATQRCKSTATNTGGPLQGDSGNIATHIHHKMTSFLAAATPIYFLAPDNLISGSVDKGIGMLLAINVAGHSWIGLNYVVTDYVPKVSKSLVGPARLVSAGVGLVTLVGLGKISFNGNGGLRGTTLALWNGGKKSDGSKKD